MSQFHYLHRSTTISQAAPFVYAAYTADVVACVRRIPSTNRFVWGVKLPAELATRYDVAQYVFAEWLFSDYYGEFRWHINFLSAPEDPTAMDEIVHADIILPSSLSIWLALRLAASKPDAGFQTLPEQGDLDELYHIFSLDTF